MIEIQPIPGWSNGPQSLVVVRSRTADDLLDDERDMIHSEMTPMAMNRGLEYKRKVVDVFLARMARTLIKYVIDELVRVAGLRDMTRFWPPIGTASAWSPSHAFVLREVIPYDAGYMSEGGGSTTYLDGVALASDRARVGDLICLERPEAKHDKVRLELTDEKTTDVLIVSSRWRLELDDDAADCLSAVRV